MNLLVKQVSFKKLNSGSKDSGCCRFKKVEFSDVCVEDTKFFAVQINFLFKRDVLLNKSGHIPMISGSDDLFVKLQDGLILLKLISLSRPDLVDMKAINKNAKMNVYQKTENLNKAIDIAGRMGCNVYNCSTKDILDGM